MRDKYIHTYAYYVCANAYVSILERARQERKRNKEKEEKRTIDKKKSKQVSRINAIVC